MNGHTFHNIIQKQNVHLICKLKKILEDFFNIQLLYNRILGGEKIVPILSCQRWPNMVSSAEYQQNNSQSHLSLKSFDINSFFAHSMASGPNSVLLKKKHRE